MKTIHQFRVVRRPADVVSRYDAIVVDGSGMPHQPLTIFYREIQPYVADGTARTYLIPIRVLRDKFKRPEKQNNAAQCCSFERELV
jgi:hypothetical protein